MLRGRLPYIACTVSFRYELTAEEFSVLFYQPLILGAARYSDCRLSADIESTAYRVARIFRLLAKLHQELDIILLVVPVELSVHHLLEEIADEIFLLREST